jgi:hypothetical protein
MTKAVTYLPLENALDRFRDTARGAETRFRSPESCALSKCISSEDIPSDEMINRRENIR